MESCSYMIAAEQKARLTYDNLLRLIDDPDVRDPLKFLRAREIVHFQRFGDALTNVQENLDAKNYYAFNPAMDIRPSQINGRPRGGMWNNGHNMNNGNNMNSGNTADENVPPELQPPTMQPKSYDH